MTWSFGWQGKAQEYDPLLVQISGSLDQRAHGQAMARAAFDAIAEWPPEQVLFVSASGYVTVDGNGRATLTVDPAPTPVDEQLAAQQPVSVLQSGASAANPAPDTAATVTEPVGDPGAVSSQANAQGEQAAPSGEPVDSSLPAGPSEAAG